MLLTFEEYQEAFIELLRSISLCEHALRKVNVCLFVLFLLLFYSSMVVLSANQQHQTDSAVVVCHRDIL